MQPITSCRVALIGAEKGSHVERIPYRLLDIRVNGFLSFVNFKFNVNMSVIFFCFLGLSFAG